jgi:hypothetical protein
MKPCKICGDLTETVFNVNFEATPICEDCAQRIFIQQAMWYIKEKDVTKARKRVKDKGDADK